MSIKLMSAVFPLPIPASKKLVLLALCDRASDAGDQCWPSIHEISEKASLSERQTQRMMSDLIDDGIIEVVKNKEGGKPGMTRHYLLHIDRLLTGDTMTPQEGRVTNKPETGDIEGGGRVTPASPNTSSKHQDNSQRLTDKKNVDKKDPTPRDPNIWDGEILPYEWCSYAEAKGIPYEQIYRSWERFKEMTERPMTRENWQRWCGREKFAGRVSDDRSGDRYAD